MRRKNTQRDRATANARVAAGLRALGGTRLVDELLVVDDVGDDGESTVMVEAAVTAMVQRSGTQPNDAALPRNHPHSE